VPAATSIKIETDEDSVTRLIFYQNVSWIITVETIQAESGSQRQR
jgi:hypothetical protein